MDSFNKRQRVEDNISEVENSAQLRIRILEEWKKLQKVVGLVFLFQKFT